MKNIILFLVIVFVSSQCASSRYPKKYEKLGIFTKDSIKEYSIGKAKDNKVSIQYLGCNNYIIKYGTDVICIDPFFSNNSFIKTSSGKIQFKPKYFNTGASYINKNNISFKDIDAFFISHSHYDHIFDLPYLLQSDSVKTDVKIYGDNSSKAVLQNFLKPHQFVNAENWAKKDSVNKWVYISSNLRVLIIPSTHASHYKKIHIMKGSCDSNYFKRFTNAKQKVNAHQFKEGHNYSFLIDVMENNKVVCRILNKTNGCEINNGMIDAKLLEEHPVDIALMQIASSNFTNCVPQNLLTQTKPKQVIIGHWENFFKPYGKQKIKTVPLTNFNVFFDRASAIKPEWPFEKLSDKFFMPRPGTMINFYY